MSERIEVVSEILRWLDKLKPEPYGARMIVFTFVDDLGGCTTRGDLTGADLAHILTQKHFPEENLHKVLDTVKRVHAIPSNRKKVQVDHASPDEDSDSIEQFG